MSPYDLLPVAEILQFWFGDEPDDIVNIQTRYQTWFKADPNFDHEVKTKFGATLDAFGASNLEIAPPNATAALVAVLVLDQFPRNIFRGNAAAFRYDKAALSICRTALDNQFDQPLQFVERVFLYLPLEHAEDIAAQTLCVSLFETLLSTAADNFKDIARTNLGHAREHRDLVARFGRFPHRNAVLGRVTSAPEAAYLADAHNQYGQN